MMGTKALIITGGDVDYKFQITKDYDIVIAVDGGLAAVDRMGLKPDVILGDFDTVAPDILHKYEEKDGIKIVRLVPEKDDTDTESAVRYAMKHGVTEIDVLGGTGSRFDHTYANMFLLKMAYENGVAMYLYTGLSKIYLISGYKEYGKEDFFGTYISFIQFDGSALGVTLKGFKYDISDFDFDTKNTYRLGVSNEPLSEKASINIREGYMLVVESLEDKER
ncbi:MAG: thiamine diphosphokinase [Lachnospiraceae bacterium]|nr:thiamine diphosphokinase [Lachnospiraceae bacterium]